MMPRLAALAVGILVVSTRALAADPGPTVREQHEVVVDGRPETWKLVWTGPRQPLCPPDEDDWATCRCQGFAFGEAGPLDLVRERDGKIVERMALASLITEKETPAPVGMVAVRRWDVHPEDRDAHKDPAFPARVGKRPLARVMEFRDYDRDGWRTEFLFQVGNHLCGSRDMALLGISRRSPMLHAFGTAEHPDRPLVLAAAAWEGLLRAEHATVTVSTCGDHGSATATDVEVRADKAGLHATSREYACTADGKRGRLVKTQVH